AVREIRFAPQCQCLLRVETEKRGRQLYYRCWVEVRIGSTSGVGPIDNSSSKLAQFRCCSRAHRRTAEGAMPTYDVNIVAAPISNLDNLKKQAKQYLRWHRERYHPVAAEIRAALPRFRHLDDLQVLDACFKLSDAQGLVARRFGFEGWRALKAGAQAMTTQSKQTATHPILSATVTQLFCSDIKASAISLRPNSAFPWISAMAIHRSMERSSETMRGSPCGSCAGRSFSGTFGRESLCCRPRCGAIPPPRSSQCSSISRFLG